MVRICGIIGISYGPGGAAAEEWTPTEFAQMMFPAIVHRGPHAFGWMSYNPETGITIEKHEGKVTDKGNAAKIELDDDCSWWVGHVRFATNGKPSHMPNNHPIAHGGVVGVHNGVLHGWEGVLRTTGREDDTAEVDSEAIFAAVNKWGVKDGLNRINGNMVTVFTETKHPEVLHIARTYGRPLVYCTTPTGALVFASECGVIDCTAIKHSDVVDFTGRFRTLTVVKGIITGRGQYRAEPPRAGSTRTVIAPRTVEQGGTHGITDFFDRPAKRNKKGRNRVPTPFEVAAATQQRKSSLDDPGEGTKRGYMDSRGGMYVGAGWYKLPDGRMMPVNNYVEWAVNNDLAKREHEAAMDAAAEFESLSRAADRGELE